MAKAQMTYAEGAYVPPLQVTNKGKGNVTVVVDVDNVEKYLRNATDGVGNYNFTGLRRAPAWLDRELRRNKDRLGEDKEYRILPAPPVQLPKPVDTPYKPKEPIVAHRGGKTPQGPKMAELGAYRN